MASFFGIDESSLGFLVGEGFDGGGEAEEDEGEERFRGGMLEIERAVKVRMKLELVEKGRLASIQEQRREARAERKKRSMGKRGNDDVVDRILDNSTRGALASRIVYHEPPEQVQAKIETARE